MRTSFLFICIVSIVLGFFSCKKNPPKERMVYYMDQEFKDYTFFKTGSFWIYKQDTSAVQDSIVVTKAEYKLLQPDSVNYSWQQYEILYKSFLNNDSTISIGDFSVGSTLFYSKQKNSSTPSSEVVSFFSLKPAGYIFTLSPSQKTAFKQNLDTLNVNGARYFNVKIFESLVSPADLKLPKITWHVKNIGVVKKQLFNGQVWNLVRYNVVQ